MSYPRQTRRVIARLFIWLLVWCAIARGTLGDEISIDLPPRGANAPGGGEFAKRIADLDLARREKEVYTAVEQGNVPRFWRRFVPVRITNTIGNRVQIIEYFVAPDYLAIGSNEDYFLAPVTPVLA